MSGFLLPHTSVLSCGGTPTVTTSASQKNQLSVDTDFDLYWKEEARNPQRNRIRIGRQYQATVPLLLKAGESDLRNLAELETLSFCPKRAAKLSDAELDHYITVAKSLSLFASLVETRSLLGRDVTIADLNHPTRIRPSANSHSQSQQALQQQLAVNAANATKLSYIRPPPSLPQSQDNKPSSSTAPPSELVAQQQLCLPDQPPMKASSDIPIINKPAKIRSRSSLKPQQQAATTAAPDSESSNSNVGSLKFFMDGQLVLKLNACQDQQEGANKCHWVQSGEKILTQKRYKKREKANSDNRTSGAGSEQSLNGTYSNSVLSSNNNYLSMDEDLKQERKETAGSFSNTTSTQRPKKQPTPKRSKLIKTSEAAASMPSNLMMKERTENPNSQPSITTASAATASLPNWLQANQFAMAAAILGGLPFPATAGNNGPDNHLPQQSTANNTASNMANPTPMDLRKEFDKRIK